MHGRLEKKREKEYAVIIIEKNMPILKCDSILMWREQ
jgi:hypothetical protein